MKTGDRIKLDEAEIAHELELTKAQQDEKAMLATKHSDQWTDWWRKIRVSKGIPKESVIIYNGKELCCVDEESNSSALPSCLE